MQKDFIKMTKGEKIEFFLLCQSLLAKHHPTSPFLMTKDNMGERTAVIRDLVANYKGFGYWDEHCAVLWNKIKVVDPTKPVDALRAHKFMAPDPMYNGVAIDFVVVDQTKNLLQFCKSNFDKNMLYCLYVKSAKPKLFRTDYIMKHVLGLPVAGSPPLIRT